MRAASERRTGRTGLARAAFGIGIVATVVFVAVVVIGNAWRDVEPALRPSDTNDPAVAHRAVGERLPEATAPADSREAESAGPATEEPVPGAAAPLCVELHDNAGRPVAGARVVVWKDDVASIHTTSEQGVATFPAPTDPAELETWRIAAAVPGRTVGRPFLPFSRPSVVTVSMGDIGALRIRCENATDRVGLSILAEANGAYHGGGGHAIAEGDAPILVAVAANTAMPFVYVVTGALGDRSAGARSAGPRGQGDVVDVTLDFASCRLIGRLASDDVGGPIHAVMVERDAVQQFRVSVEVDGTFEVELPRSPEATVSLVRGRQCAPVPRTSFTTSTEDLGAITFAERPRLGFFEVRDEHNVLCLDSPAIDRVTTAYGTTIEKPSPGAALHFGATLDKGVDVFGVPGLVAAEVAPSKRDMFCVPGSLTIRDGGMSRAMFVTGGTVVVRAKTTGLNEWHVVTLVGRANGKAFDHVAMQVDGDGHRYTFGGLPPGEYRVEAAGARVVGNMVAVLAGSEQEVDVTVVP